MFVHVCLWCTSVCVCKCLCACVCAGPNQNTRGMHVCGVYVCVCVYVNFLSPDPHRDLKTKKKYFVE